MAKFLLEKGLGIISCNRRVYGHTTVKSTDLEPQMKAAVWRVRDRSRESIVHSTIDISSNGTAEFLWACLALRPGHPDCRQVPRHFAVEESSSMIGVT